MATQQIDPPSAADGPGPARFAALAPFGVPVFRMLWIAGLVSNIGSWMQTVGAQWLLVEGDAPAAVIALVQTASAAPVLLLAIPGGVLGEFMNRRRVLLVAQIVQLAVVVVLTVLTLAGDTTPALLLTITFLLGAASAVQLPSYQAIVPDVVPTRMIPDAAALSSIGVNVARAIGPAVAGLVVAQFGVAAVFAANAVSFLVFLAVLVLWRGYRPPEVRPEPFLDATRAGLRYIRHSDIVRSLYLRLALFLLPANALWALLPIFAEGPLGLDAGGYGLLLAALGVGAIGGAVVLPLARRRLSVNGVVLASSLVYGAGLVALVFAPTLALALPVLVVTGLAWIGVIATVNGTVQAFLPTWVRTRGLSVYQLVLFGGTAAGSALTGVLATALGAPAVIAGAGVLVALLAASQLIWRIPSAAGIGRDIVPFAGADADPSGDDDDRSVLVLVDYTVAPEHRAAFVDAMGYVQESRYRTGARHWRLYEDPANPGVIVEAFTVGTWREHESQMRSRITRYDDDVITRARALSTGKPTTHHLLDVPVRWHRTERVSPTEE